MVKESICRLITKRIQSQSVQSQSSAINKMHGEVGRRSIGIGSVGRWAMGYNIWYSIGNSLDG